MTPEESEAFVNRITELGNQNITNQLTDKAGKDPDFRKDLLRAPRETVSKFLGLDLPVGINIRVVEESPSELWLVLPSPAATASTTTLTPAAVKAGWKEK
jgi:hypothetical protein